MKFVSTIRELKPDGQAWILGILIIITPQR